MRSALALAVAIPVVLAGVWAPQTQGPSAAIVGPPETVFDWSSQACVQEHIPDGGARAFRDADGQIQLIISHGSNHRMIGPDFDHLARDCSPVMVARRDPRPEMFDDEAWLGGLYTIDGRTIHALTHIEYHGQNHGPSHCPSGSNNLCWYDSVGLAVSTDGGRSYAHRSPPSHLVAALPYRYEPDNSGMGYYGPSNVVRSPKDRFRYYAFVMQVGRRLPPGSHGACLIRTSTPDRPGSWRAWDGQGFRHRFVDPYREQADPGHLCKPLVPEITESLTYNTYLRKWVLVGSAARQQGDRYYGLVQFRTASDLVHWSEPQTIIEVEFPTTFGCGDPEPIIAYPSLVDHASSSRTFQTVGRRAYLYYTRFNYTNCQMTYDRDLARVPVEFSQ